MSKASSYTLNDRMELAGPPIEEQLADAVARMERHGVKVERVKQGQQPDPAVTGRKYERNNPVNLQPITR